METRKFSPPRGMRDLSQREYRSMSAHQEKLQQLLFLHGYEAIDVPLLEETELFLRKSGGELAASLYSFTDPSGWRVSLRPEFTSSVIRRYLQEAEEGAQSFPRRFQYAGPVFRFEPADKGGGRQYTQVGAELIGVEAPWADAEVLSLAWEGLKELKLTGQRMVIGHPGITMRLLEQLQVSDRAKVFLAGSLSRFKRGLEDEITMDAERRGLLRANGGGSSGSSSGVLDQDTVQAFLNSALSVFMGSRSQEEVVGRFLRKSQGLDDPVRVKRGMELLSRISKIQGTPEEAIAGARREAKAQGLDDKPFDELESILDLLKLHDVDMAQFEVDFGLARGIAYYTGMVFEVTHPALPPDCSLGGGGRYDGLIKALGGSEDVPALGYAYDLDRVQQVLDATDTRAAKQPASSSGTLVIANGNGAYRQAVALARELRSKNRVVYLDVSTLPLEEHLKYARECGVERLSIVDEKGQAKEYTVEAKG